MLFSDSAPEKVCSVGTSVSIANPLALGFALWSSNDMSMIVWIYDGVTNRDACVVCVPTLCPAYT